MDPLSTAVAGLLVDMVRGELPEEAQRVRLIGCPQSRQFEVLELGQAMFVREIACEANPDPGNAVACLWSAPMFNRLAAAVLKENDKDLTCLPLS